MTGGKKFVIDSIKMDLFRVVTAAGDITKKLPTKLIQTFLQHADESFDKITLEPREKSIRTDLRNLAGKLDGLVNPHQRLRWTEEAMTLRCRL